MLLKQQSPGIHPREIDLGWGQTLWMLLILAPHRQHVLETPWWGMSDLPSHSEKHYAVLIPEDLCFC